MTIFRRNRRQELGEEVQSHLHMAEEDRIAQGESAVEAKQSARREFGNVDLVKDVTREIWGWASIERLVQDLRYGLRMLRKNPGFTIVAVLTLALGIGANTAIFSIVNAVMLRPLPFDHPSRLVLLHEGIPKIGYPKMEFSPPDLVVFAREQRSFSALGAFQDERVNISGQGEPERVLAARVSAPLFPMLGAQPALGRTFSSQEDAPGHNVAILSYGLWQRRFGGAPDVAGQTIELDRQPYTIVGVMQRSFVFPLSGPEVNGSPAEIFVPMAFTPDELQAWGGRYFISVLGRLRPGVTLDQAHGEMESLADRVVDSYPTGIADLFHRVLTITPVSFQTEVVGSVRTLLLVLMIAVAFVLLIACANVATLLLSRAATRQKEIAIRTALGATRVRLIRQMFTESLFLALAGGALGLLVAVWSKSFILALVPASIPLPRQVPVNAGVLAFSLVVSILAALLFGLAPALESSDAALQAPLQEGGRGGTPSRPRHRLQGVFVAAEFALALVLLVGAGLLIRSFAKLLGTHPGFRPDHLLTLTIPLSPQAYRQGAQVYDFYKQVLERTSSLPGVHSAALSNDLPLNGHEMVSFSIEGRQNAEGNTPEAVCQSWILGNYFETMGIPLLQGRWFTPGDQVGSQLVAIVDRSMARKYWPQGAIGKRIKWGGQPWETIVGVVGDVKEGPLNSDLVPHVYRPYSQIPAFLIGQDPFGDWHAMNLSVRTQTDPVSQSSSVVAQVHSLDHDLAVSNIRTMTQLVSSSFSGPEFTTVLLGALAGLALFLAAIGIYGVLAYVVAQQTHDIGVRMALGARPRDIFGLVIRRGVRLAAIGSLIGLAAVIGLTRLMKSLLYGVGAMDPLTLAGVVVLLIAVALLAVCIPARRAMRVDPMVALRHE
ncbi:MAG TPA: ABC transporter permease [Candidatus Acidoferrales bacterium]|nr:ABC transporter permease [Candidatus Acidoferrales bacterium]